MSYKAKPVQYFYALIRDQPGESHKVMSTLVDLGINMHAFTAIPIGSDRTQLTIFPTDPAKMIHDMKLASLDLDGPHHAILVQGDDHLGALTGIHSKLFEANINVYASSGVADNSGGYGYIIYVKSEDFERALKVLEI